VEAGSPPTPCIGIPTLGHDDPSLTLLTHRAEAGMVSVQRNPTLSYLVLP